MRSRILGAFADGAENGSATWTIPPDGGSGEYVGMSGRGSGVVIFDQEVGRITALNMGVIQRPAE